MVQAAVLDGLQFDAPPFSQDGFTAAEVDVSRGEVADALVVALVDGPCDGNGDVSLARACPADQHEVALLVQELPRARGHAQASR